MASPTYPTPHLVQASNEKIHVEAVAFSDPVYRPPLASCVCAREGRSFVVGGVMHVLIRLQDVLFEMFGNGVTSASASFV